MGKILRESFDMKEIIFLGKTIETEQILPKTFFSPQNDPHRAKPSFSDVLMNFPGN